MAQQPPYDYGDRKATAQSFTNAVVGMIGNYAGSLEPADFEQAFKDAAKEAKRLADAGEIGAYFPR